MKCFFTAGTSHWTTGSSGKPANLSKNSPDIYDISNLVFFPVIAIFDATLFCDDFDSSDFN